MTLTFVTQMIHPFPNIRVLKFCSCVSISARFPATSIYVFFHLYSGIWISNVRAFAGLVSPHITVSLTILGVSIILTEHQITGYRFCLLHTLVYAYFSRCIKFKILVFPCFNSSMHHLEEQYQLLHNHQPCLMRTNSTLDLHRTRQMLEGKYMCRSSSSFCFLPNPLINAGTSSFSPHKSSRSELEILHVYFFRVPSTNIPLKLGLHNEQSEKANIRRTMLQTQLEVKNFIAQNNATSNIDRHDDPSESDVRYTGYLFGLR